MVMGPTHAMSGAALWLGAAAASAPILGGQTASAVVVGTAVCAGSALLPDIDCPGSMSTKDGSTVVRAFGIVGEVVGHSMDNIALAVYNLTRGKKDKPRNSGHRTLTHTAVFTAGLGFAVSAGASLPGSFNAFGREWGTGNVFALTVMWAMLHLSMFGLLEKWTKKQRAKYGLLAVMAISGTATLITAAQLERTDGGFAWLGLAVGAGAVMHCLGDAITKAGVPFLWPIPINGKRWYDITLPSIMRIRAGGWFEYTILLPVLTFYTFAAAIYLIPGGKPLIQSGLRFLGG
jgi:membrane-bound metal-dependent hydrolase YbcI (DUF457 family)